MKTVGVFTRIDNLNDKSIHYISSDIFYKLKNKVNVILIPFALNDSFEDVVSRINLCDGIILPGGNDIYPLELDVCKYLYEKDIPLLGICLGMQTMAYAMGGTMEKLHDLSHKTKISDAHEVNICPGTVLEKLIRKNKIMVNSRHQDYISSTTLTIGATSPDGIIEEVEDSSRKFFIGVQWHPENLNDENTNRLFSYFVNML